MKGKRDIVAEGQGPRAPEPMETSVGNEVIDWPTIFTTVVATGKYNYNGARVPVPSGLCMQAWERNLVGYGDYAVVDFLKYGWPANCSADAIMIPTWHNHPSADRVPQDITHYIRTERGHAAIMGPFSELPFTSMQLSPLMTRPKRDSEHRRVIVDLSWPQGASVNDAISEHVDGPARIRLPTVDYMEGRLKQLGQGAYLYKSDLARGYRQLRIDPTDWSLLGFTYEGKFYFAPHLDYVHRRCACSERRRQSVGYMARGAMYRVHTSTTSGEPRQRAEKQRRHSVHYRPSWQNWD